jgi:hypothetical protein
VIPLAFAQWSWNCASVNSIFLSLIICNNHNHPFLSNTNILPPNPLHQQLAIFSIYYFHGFLSISHFIDIFFNTLIRTDFIFPFPVNAAFPSNPDKIMHLEDLDDCEIEPQPDLVEHCTLERTFYRLKIRSNKERKGDQQQKQGKTATALWLREKNCANRLIN